MVPIVSFQSGLNQVGLLARFTKGLILRVVRVEVHQIEHVRQTLDRLVHTLVNFPFAFEVLHVLVSKLDGDVVVVINVVGDVVVVHIVLNVGRYLLLVIVNNCVVVVFGEIHIKKMVRVIRIFFTITFMIVFMVVRFEIFQTTPTRVYRNAFATPFVSCNVQLGHFFVT